ncbi:MAG TPA: hypothetical protein VLH75_17260 [Longimicrobiales bacterium]|nr:hypothetical protein [Longimicrobiales bacterium]
MLRARASHLLLVLLVAACSGDGATGPTSDPPPGPDTGSPFPLDRGDDGAATPGTYKGLWLRLTDNGAPNVTAVDGVVGLVCVGMSNANQECTAFIAAVRGAWAGEVSTQVRVANCAVGGRAVEAWMDPAQDAVLWDDCVARKLPAAGIRADQARVIWHKAADMNTTGPGGSRLPVYPDPASDYFTFQRNLTAFAARVKAKLPSVQAVYSSSRSYGGFAGSFARGEPLSYEEGHALNAWLADHASVDGVWYGWGAYLWAPACDTGFTNGSGVCYERADYVDDGVHPSDAGRAKIARLVHERFRREAWYRR